MNYEPVQMLSSLLSPYHCDLMFGNGAVTELFFVQPEQRDHLYDVFSGG